MMLRLAGMKMPLTEDDADLFDTAYLPTKYPLGVLAPDFTPDEEVARRCLTLAEQVLAAGRGIITG